MLNPTLRGRAEYHSHPSQRRRSRAWSRYSIGDSGHRPNANPKIRKPIGYAGSTGKPKVAETGYLLRMFEARGERTVIVRQWNCPSPRSNGTAKSKGIAPLRTGLRNVWRNAPAEPRVEKHGYRKEWAKSYVSQEEMCALGGCETDIDSGCHDHHIVRRVDSGSDALGIRVLVQPNSNHKRRSLGLTVVKPASI